MENTASSAFKVWFGHSQVVDESGNPLICYHGTKTDIAAFSQQLAGSSDPGLLGKAFYFTPSRAAASEFATNRFYGTKKGEHPNVVPVYLSIQNPLRIHDGRLPDGRTLTDLHPNGISTRTAGLIQRQIKRLGHDGALFYLDHHIVQVVAFAPEQIKSVYNSGNWNPQSSHLSQ